MIGSVQIETANANIKIDWFLALALVLQVLFSVILMFSVSTTAAELFYEDPMYFVKKHLLALLIAVPLVIGIARYWSSEYVQKFALYILVFAGVLVLLTLIPGIGYSINGSRRWLKITSFQILPQPTVIFCVLVFVSTMLANGFHKINLWSKPSLILLSVTAFFVAAFYLQPDQLSGLMLIGLVILCCAIAGWYKFSTLLASITSVFLFFLATSSYYRLERLKALFDPWGNRFDTGYQTVLGMLSVGGGDIWGVGYGRGVVKTALSEAHSKYVFASLIEEIGAFGGTILLLLSFIIFWRCFLIAHRLRNANRTFESILSYVLSFWMMAFTLLHVLNVLGTLPLVSVVYPLLSYGGSYMVVFIISIALILKFDSTLSDEQRVSTKPYKRATVWLLSLAWCSMAYGTVGKAVFDEYLDSQYGVYREVKERESKPDPLGFLLASKRGWIHDRFGQILGKSIPTYDIFADPKHVNIEEVDWLSLSVMLDIDKQETLERVQSYRDAGKRFIFLKKGVEPAVAYTSRELNLDGVRISAGEKRLYPFGESVAHVVGITDLDGDGLEGIERSYNHVLSDSKSLEKLQLSIDQRMQQIAYKTLTYFSEEKDIEKGAAIVLDTKNGEVLAMVSYPSYDPNNREFLRLDSVVNNAVAARVEPGATLGPLILMGALSDSDLGDPSSSVDTSPGVLQVGENIIRDPVNYGNLSWEDLVTSDSKVGFAKVALGADQESLWQMLNDLRLSSRTGIELPGEVSGYLPQANELSDIKIATIAYGYGLAITPIQLSQAYLALANNGEAHAVTLLKGGRSRGSISVSTPAVAEQIRLYLERDPIMTITDERQVETSNAGRGALIQKVGPTGYEDRYTGLFVGMFPLESPRFLVFVMMDEADIEKNEKLGDIAEQAFREIASQIVQLDTYSFR